MEKKKKPWNEPVGFVALWGLSQPLPAGLQMQLLAAASWAFSSFKLQPKTEDQKQEGVAGPQHMEPQPCEGKDRFSSHDLPVRMAGRFAQQTPGIH